MSPLEAVKLWLCEYLKEILTFLGTVILVVAGIGASYQWAQLLVFGLVGAGAICSLLGIVYDRSQHRPRLAELTKGNRELEEKVLELESRVDNGNVDLLKVVDVLLRDLAVDTNLYKTDARLSVYRHDEGQFVLLGRVSPNQAYAKPGRQSYPDTQGFIAQVWNGTLEKPKISLPEDRRAWIDTQVNAYGLSEEEAKGLRMHTRTMCGIRLQRDRHGPAYGVLCVESDKPRATVQAKTVGEVEQTPQFRLITDILPLSVTAIHGGEASKGLARHRRIEPSAPPRRAITETEGV